MDEKVNQDLIAIVSAVVPTDQPGGPYRENGYTVIPIKIEDITFMKERVLGDEHESKIKEGVSLLQEIILHHDISIERGSKIKFELDYTSLWGCTFWEYESKELKRVIRAEPSAVEIRYERPKK